MGWNHQPDVNFYPKDPLLTPKFVVPTFCRRKKHREIFKNRISSCHVFGPPKLGEVLNHPHLGLSLKPGQIYAFCQLESKCKGDRSKVGRDLWTVNPVVFFGSTTMVSFFWRPERKQLQWVEISSPWLVVIWGIILPTYMAAAQNVRSGSSLVPTHDPDLRSRPFERIWSRPLIQTFGMI